MEPVVRLLTTTQPIFEKTLTETIDDYQRFEAFYVYPYLKDELDIVEYAGRWDYGENSISKMGDRSIISRWLASGEESMIEMVDATFFIECSRVVTHELVRHRLASYQQESQRFVRYDGVDVDDLFIMPDELTEEQAALMKVSFQQAKDAYLALKAAGVKNQIARYVLPNSTRTRIIAKMDLREWRHVLRLRAHTSAQPEFRVIALKILDILNGRYPEVFADVKKDIEAQVRAAR